MKYLSVVFICLLITLSLVQSQTTVIDLTPGVSDYYLEVTRGNINGHTIINKFGANAGVGTDYADIWDGGNNYNWLSSPVYLQISSSDTDDTSGGSGSQTVTIKGLDENYLEYSETVTLNGQTPVNTTGQFIRVFRMLINNVGGSGHNEGDIYASTGGVASGVPSNSSQVYAKITSTLGQTLMALYTIPADKEGFLIKGFATSDGSKNVNVRYFNRPFNSSRNIKFDFDMSDNFIYEFGVPSGPIQPKTDLWVSAKINTGTSKISSGFDLILIEI